MRFDNYDFRFTIYDLKIVWTNTATESYEDIINYLLERWALKEVHNFFKKPLLIIEKIEHYNEIGEKHELTIYRKFLISKQTYLFYSVRKNKIYLNLFWNNRQNPEKLRKILQP